MRQAPSTQWDNYLAQAQSTDECLGPYGRPRQSWSRLFTAMGELDANRLRELDKTAKRLFHDNGATFHMHAGDDAPDRPWELDPIPVVLDAREWRDISCGLRQRVRLLNRILADLMGPQTLIRERLLPPDLILRHPGFLRACSGSLPPERMRLALYGADIARGPSGRMWVVRDRTSTPPGLGYALENRTILAQLFPREFRDLHVERLSQTFRALRDGFNPAGDLREGFNRVVFLTPGPYSRSYFEHAYLAAYLGYTLVQGDDLLVRDGRVWLKSLSGLQPVHVILRHVHDEFCDPLELRGDSQLGVPGLLEAVRRGNVALANPLGSQVLENPGLYPFIPRIAEKWLGEDLQLPHAASWWCGQKPERDYVLQHMDELFIKTYDRSPIRIGDDVVYPPFLASTELREHIEREPWRFVGQERLSFSTVPVLSGGQLEPRAVTLRTFTAYEGPEYRVLPGALACCGEPKQSDLVDRLAGGICKDTWILGENQQTFDSLWVERQEETRQRPLIGLYTSTAAENLFWSGRYAERASSLVRTIRGLLREEDQDDFAPHGRDMLHCDTRLWQGLLDQAAASSDEQATLSTIRDIALSSEVEGGVSANITAFARSAFFVRENWSNDTWRVITRIGESSPEEDHQHTDLRKLQDQLDDLIILFQAFAGQCSDSMSRTDGWQFLDLGRQVERGQMMLTLLHPVLEADDVEQAPPLEAMLEIHENLITYRRAYRTTPDLPTVMHLLLAEPSNPTSFRSILIHISSRLRHLARSTHRPATDVLASEVTTLVNRLDAFGDDNWNALTHLEEATSIPSFLQDAKETLLSLGSELSHLHFKHAGQRARALPTIRIPSPHLEDGE